MNKTKEYFLESWLPFMDQDSFLFRVCTHIYNYVNSGYITNPEGIVWVQKGEF